MKAKPEAKSATGTTTTPFEAFSQAGSAWMAPAQFLEGWQRQMNAGLQMTDAMLANATKIYDTRLPGVSEAMARFAALQKSLLEARTPTELWTLQCNWAIENAAWAMGFWKEMFDAANVANANLFACARGEAQPAGSGVAPAGGQAAVGASAGSLASQDLVKTAMVTMDTAYGQMLKGSQQMMAAATEAMNAGMRLATPPASTEKRRPA